VWETFVLGIGFVSVEQQFRIRFACCVPCGCCGWENGLC